MSLPGVHLICVLAKCLYRKYKGSKIDWDVDECAQPFDPVPIQQPRKENPTQKKNGKSMANRFHLLNLDGEDDDDDISSPFRPKEVVGITA